MGEDVTYLYNKICLHCGKIISEVKDSPHPQPCPFCREYFVIGRFSQLVPFSPLRPSGLTGFRGEPLTGLEKEENA